MTDETAGADDQNENDLPRGLIEGVGSLTAAFDTPDILRDCLREHYVERLTRAALFDAARRLADDLKRRHFTKAMALEIVLSLVSRRLTLGREQHQQVEKAVTWVFDEQEHGLTCTGVLAREGMCFKTERRCRFDEQAQDLHTERVASTSQGLPTAWTQYLEGVHPTEVLFVSWTYAELVRYELKNRCTPGDERTPIFVGYRVIADGVRATRRTGVFDKNVALRSVRRLQEIGLVRMVVKGESGTRRRKANGYVRVVPVPQPPLPIASTSPDEIGRSNDVAGGAPGVQPPYGQTVEPTASSAVQSPLVEPGPESDQTGGRP